MQKVFLAVFFIAILLSVIFYFKTSHQKDVHFHAGFQVYLDGKLQDFSKPTYMSMVPCTKDGHPMKTKDKVHLHDSVGDMVHVHKPNVVWNDLFQYLRLELSGKQVNAYVNGKEVSDIGEEEIGPYDSLVLLVGKHGEVKEYLNNALSEEYIKEKETESGLCAG